MLQFFSNDRKQKPSKSSRRPLQIQSLEDRKLLAANIAGATWRDTGEYLLGSVAVTTILFESVGNQQTQNWTTEEIDQTIDKVVAGVTWWSDLLDSLNTVHELEFVFDHTFAETPFETIHEPIDLPSHSTSGGGQQGHELYLGDFLTAQNISNALSLEDAMWEFNHSQREKLGTDWSFTILIADASDDPDGLFADTPGGFPAAFALPGGLYMVVPSGRSASTIAHELGHIFWAFDEYTGGESYYARRGYYDTQNTNATDDNPDRSQQQDSIMRGGVPLNNAFHQLTSAPSSLALVGWQDSDNDGIFDVLDVPLDLTGIGHYDGVTGQYRFQGSAQAVPLFNTNSYGESPSVEGTNSDITLNKVDAIEYRIDQGAWQTALTPNQQFVDFDISIPINGSFTSIEWRAIDQTVGVTSAVVDGSMTEPAISDASFSGYAYLDANGNGSQDENEMGLAGTTVEIRDAIGNELFGGEVRAEDFQGTLPDFDGVTLTVEAPVTEFGPFLREDLKSLNSVGAGNRHVFHAQEFTPDGTQGIDGRTRDRWEKRQFVATFDQTVGEVSLDVIGLNSASYGRIEAYDESGNLVARVTCELAQGEVETMTIQDPAGSIKTIKAFGLKHSRTGIAISRIQYGFTSTTVTDESGAWRLPNLPDGNYVVELTTDRVIHQFDAATFSITVNGSATSSLGAKRVDSPRYNSAIPHDANQDGNVTSLDALVIINDIARNTIRFLTHDETEGFDVDVNNDGFVSALDALLVINQLGRSSAIEGESIQADQASQTDAVFSELGNEDPSPSDSQVIKSSQMVFSGPVHDLFGVFGSEDPNAKPTVIDLSNEGIDRQLGGEQDVSSAFEAELSEPLAQSEI